MNDERPRFFFVHLQKTAGTALLRRLRHHFGAAAVYPRPDEQGTPRVVLDVDHLRHRLAALDGEIEVVTGHFPLAVTDLLPGRYVTFTVLRDPVERTLSFLRHQRDVEPRFAEASLEDIYEDPVSTGGLLTNHMVKMLSLTADEMTDGALTAVPVDDARLAAAARNLSGRIDVVGLQEHFEVFCRDLEASFGWDLGAPVFMNRTTSAEADAGLQERIRSDNGYDVRLYEHAVALWRDRHPEG